MMTGLKTLENSQKGNTLDTREELLKLTVGMNDEDVKEMFLTLLCRASKIIRELREEIKDVKLDREDVMDELARYKWE